MLWLSHWLLVYMVRQWIKYWLPRVEMLGYFNYVYGANPCVSPTGTFSSPSQTQNKTGIPFPHWKHPFSQNSAKNTKILTNLRPRSSTAHVEHTVMRLHPLFETDCHTFKVTFLVVQNVSLPFPPHQRFLARQPTPHPLGNFNADWSCPPSLTPWD